MKASEFFDNYSSLVGSYKSFVISQVNSMKVDDLKLVDVGDKDPSAFRMNLNQFAIANGKKFRTKISNGELYVGRIL